MKTKQTYASVDKFIKEINDPVLREDCKTLAAIMTEITGHKPKMWGTSIVGFGATHYKYASGHEGDWLVAGFSPRKESLTLYIMTGFDGYGDLMKKLGKHCIGKSCLYIKRLSDVHLPTLKKSNSAISQRKAIERPALVQALP